MTASLGVVLAVAVCALGFSQDEPPTEDLVRGPYLQSLLETSVKILWSTSAPSIGRVRYFTGESPEAVELTEDHAGTRHVVELRDLHPDTVYSYEVLAGDRPLATGDGYRFRTAPPLNQGSFRVAVIGDSGTASDEQFAIAELIDERDPDLFLNAGDVTYGRPLDAVVFGPYRPILARACLYPCRGNHDFDLGDPGTRWRDIFPPPPFLVTVDDDEVLHPPCCDGPPDPPDPTWLSVSDPAHYSFDWGSAHFSVVDWFTMYEACISQMRWLCADLAAARQRGLRWLIILLHQPVYNVGAHSYNTRARGFFRELMDHYEVDLVLSGHDHNYQCTYPVRDEIVRDAWQDPIFVFPRGTVYVVTGGGGSGLYSVHRGGREGRFQRRSLSVHHMVELTVTPTRLQAVAISAQGEQVDQFTLLKEGERPHLEFLRGDVSSDGDIDIGDAVASLRFLFTGQNVDCPAVADTNSSGVLSIADPIRLLVFLFLGGPPPAPPFPDCGPVPDADDAWCRRGPCL